MARYREDWNDDRDIRARRERPGAEDWDYGDSRARDRARFADYRRPEYGRGRFGERAEYEDSEPRYSDERRYRDDNYGVSLDDRREHLRRGFRDYNRIERSRLRCRDIMTRDLSVATRDTTLGEVALMMKQEDTGVIPVVEYEISGNGKTKRDDDLRDNRGFSRGKLVGLVTDRDITIRAVAEGKDCAATRAEEVMTTSIQTARVNDRVVDVIRKMGDKQVRRIPVVGENGYLRGIISMADVALETEEDRELAHAIEDISQGSSFWSRIFG